MTRMLCCLFSCVVAWESAEPDIWVYHPFMFTFFSIKHWRNDIHSFSSDYVPLIITPPVIAPHTQTSSSVSQSKPEEMESFLCHQRKLVLRKQPLHSNNFMIHKLEGQQVRPSVVRCYGGTCVWSLSDFAACLWICVLSVVCTLCLCLVFSFGGVVFVCSMFSRQEKKVRYWGSILRKILPNNVS